MNQYHLPTVDKVIHKIGSGKSHSAVIDLSNAYLQLSVGESSRELLTINTHKGLFRFLRVPFGLADAPASFQEQIDKILHGLENTAGYMDDIIVTGESVKNLYDNIRKVFLRLKDFNAKVNAEKSKFFETSVNFLGHEINSEGIKPAKDKVEALIKAPRPTNVTEVRAFLGLVNFYRKFVKGITEVVYPLYELERKDQKFVWTKSYEDASNKVKDAIVNSPVITNFDPTKETILTTDASSYGIGAVLSQTDKGQEKVV